MSDLKSGEKSIKIVLTRFIFSKRGGLIIMDALVWFLIFTIFFLFLINFSEPFYVYIFIYTFISVSLIDQAKDEHSHYVWLKV